MSTAMSKKIPYVRLGNSGLKVSKIILGCMQYGSPEWEGWVLGEDAAMEHIKAAYDAGIQTFDTANTYSNGLSETFLGRAIKKHNLPRDELVIMTKVFWVSAKTPGEIYWRAGDPDPDTVGYVNQHGLSRKHIFESVKHSLERLQLDYIDVLQCHRWDPETPVAETMQALHDVVKAGLVRYIGMSSCYAWQFNIMQNYALSHNLTPFISMQNHYSLLYREEEREMFPTLKHFGVGSIPWSPLARGLLTRPLKERTKRNEADAFLSVVRGGDALEEIISRVEEIAKKKGINMATVAMAWILAKDGVVAPIVGTTSLKNLQELVEGVHTTLTDEEIKYLEVPYKPREIVGHW